MSAATDELSHDLATHWQREWAGRARDHPGAARQGFVLTHQQCYALDFSRAQIRSLVRRRVWSGPRTGVVAIIDPAGDAKVAAALAATAAALTHRGAIISHHSAAILHGLPVLVDPKLPTLTAPTRNGQRNGAFMHLAWLDPDERSEWYGAPVTSPSRTVVDISRSAGPAAGLITADAALRAGLTSLEELRAAAASAAGRPGAVGARWCAEHANGLSESPHESLTRARLLLAGLPSPQLQVWIPEAGARVDMLYEAERLVIEADGLLKYTTPADLRDEKRRQERLERAGYRVLRVLWVDVFGEASEFVTRVNRARRKTTLRPPRP